MIGWADCQSESVLPAYSVSTRLGEGLGSICWVLGTFTVFHLRSLSPLGSGWNDHLASWGRSVLWTAKLTGALVLIYWGDVQFQLPCVLLHSLVVRQGSAGDMRVGLTTSLTLPSRSAPAPVSSEVAPCNEPGAYHPGQHVAIHTYETLMETHLRIEIVL